MNFLSCNCHASKDSFLQRCLGSAWEFHTSPSEVVTSKLLFLSQIFSNQLQAALMAEHSINYWPSEDFVSGSHVPTSYVPIYLESWIQFHSLVIGSWQSGLNQSCSFFWWNHSCCSGDRNRWLSSRNSLVRSKFYWKLMAAPLFLASFATRLYSRVGTHISWAPPTCCFVSVSAYWSCCSCGCRRLAVSFLQLVWQTSLSWPNGNFQSPSSANEWSFWDCPQIVHTQKKTFCYAF